MLFAATTAVLVTGTGCASLFSRGDKTPENSDKNAYSATEPNDPLAAKDQRIQSLESTVVTLNSRVQELEGKLQATQNRPVLSDSLIRQSVDALTLPKRGGSVIRATVSENDPESGFANDQNTRAYQQGKILFDQEKYPEAILAYSAFLERNANHSLASQAQYGIAESYYLEADFAVADQEFQKLVIKYPRSPRASYALVRLSQCAEKTGKLDESRRYRMQAEALYPRSPALKGLREKSAPAPVMQSSLVIPPTAPEVDSPVVETPHVEAPQVVAPRVEMPKVETPRVQKLETTNTTGNDLDGPPGSGGGG